VEKQIAMGNVLDRWRLDRGWNPYDDETQQAAIASYVRSLDIEKVPPDAYMGLYERVLKARAISIAKGDERPVEFGADQMIAQWLGANGLNAERRISADKQLEMGGVPNPCEMCFGTGKQLFTGLPCPNGCKAEARAA
jgi:hypothetical protein